MLFGSRNGTAMLANVGSAMGRQWVGKGANGSAIWWLKKLWKSAAIWRACFSEAEREWGVASGGAEQQRWWRRSAVWRRSSYFCRPAFGQHKIGQMVASSGLWMLRCAEPSSVFFVLLFDSSVFFVLLFDSYVSILHSTSLTHFFFFEMGAWRPVVALNSHSTNARSVSSHSRNANTPFVEKPAKTAPVVEWLFFFIIN